MSENQQWDAVVIGSGIGGLVTASQLAAKGAKTLVLERYLIPGGSGGAFKRDGYTFDVGASMIFGFGKKGFTNLLTRALLMWGSTATPSRPRPARVPHARWAAHRRGSRLRAVHRRSHGAVSP